MSSFASCYLVLVNHFGIVSGDSCVIILVNLKSLYELCEPTMTEIQ